MFHCSKGRTNRDDMYTPLTSGGSWGQERNTPQLQFGLCSHNGDVFVEYIQKHTFGTENVSIMCY